jgi:hypothetical protein
MEFKVAFKSFKLNGSGIDSLLKRWAGARGMRVLYLYCDLVEKAGQNLKDFCCG